MPRMRDPRPPEYIPESDIRRALVQATATRAGEIVGVIRRDLMHVQGVLPAAGREAGCHRDAPIFVILCMSDDEGAGVEIHIGHLQIQRFRDSEPTAIDHPKHQGIRPLSLTQRMGGGVIRGGKKSP